MRFSWNILRIPVLIFGLCLLALDPCVRALPQFGTPPETLERKVVPDHGELVDIRVRTNASPLEVQFEWTGGVRRKGVRLSGPERLYFDLEGTRLSSAIEDHEFPIENEVASRVRVGQNSRDITRVVFDLNRGDIEYTVEDTVQPPGFRVRFSGRSFVERNNSHLRAVDASERRLASGPSSTKGKLTGVRVGNGASPLEVLFEWTGNSRRNGIRLSGPNRLYFDLEGTRIASTLEGREFIVNNGVAQRVRVGQNGPNMTRVVFDLEEGDISYTVEDTVQPEGFRVRFIKEVDAQAKERTGGRDRSVQGVRSQAATLTTDRKSEPVVKGPSPNTAGTPTVAALSASAEPGAMVANGVGSEGSSFTAAVSGGGGSSSLDGFERSAFRESNNNPPSVSALQRGDVPVLSGRRRSNMTQHSITLEGIGALEMRFGELEFSSSEASVQSVAEIVNPFKVRKRGRLYGSVYEYHRNDNFDARNFFDPVGEPLPEFKRNQFGVSFGAFLSQRLNVFGTYDGLRIVRGSTLLSHIATPEMKQGDFSSLSTQLVNPFTGELFENNQIPQHMVNPVAQRMLSTIPTPNRADPDRNFVNNLPLIENQDDISALVDYEISPDTKLFSRYSFNEREGANVTYLPAFGTNENSRTQSLSLDLNRNLGPTFVTSSRINLRRTSYLELSKNAEQTGLLESLGIAGLSKADELDEGYPYFRLDGYASMGLSRRNESPRTSFHNTLEVGGDVTWAPSNHKLSFGAEIRFYQMNNVRTGGHRRGSFRFTGNYTGDAFADFLLGIPDSATHSLGSDRGDFRKRSWSLSFRDEWKVNPKLNLSFLLGYNRYGPYRSVHDNVSIFWPLLFEPPTDGELIVIGSEQAAAVGLTGLGPGEGLYEDTNDWAPGMGLAYSPLGNNRLVLRLSYGIRYRPSDYRDTQQFLGRNYPFFYFEEADAPENSPDTNLSNPFDAITASETAVRGFDPYLKTAYLQQWLFSLQNEFMRNWTFELSYRGQKSTRLPIELPANIPLPGPGAIQNRRPNPAYGRFDILTGSGSSAGHSLQAQVDKRLSRGFSVRSGFSWDRVFSDVFYRDPTNPRNLRAERALSYYSPKRFFLNYIYDLPFGPESRFSTAWAGKLGFLFAGWRISGITNITGGRPFAPLLKGDANNDGLTGDRPDRIGSGRLSSEEQSIDRWFATEDFVKPARYGFGNAGRSILLTPAQRVWDISLIKRTDLSREGSMLEFRVQFFNAFNHTNFDEPEETYGTSTFGQIFNADEAREIEFALKYSF